MKNIFVRLIVNGIALVLATVLMGMAAIALILFHFSQDLPSYTALANYNPLTVTRLYAADGKLLAEYAVEKRVYVPLSAVPKRVIQAFISAEDRNFYTNSGLDISGIGRAVMQNLHNLAGGKHALVGGSTITQQVVKNFMLTNKQTLTRKIKEAILAYRITQVYSKDRILELYLNEIYLGRGSYGIAAAALNYFDKSLDELTIEEAAVLAAMPKEPAYLDPGRYYERAKARRDAIINAMMDQGYITADMAREAIAKPITLRARDATEMAHADFFAEEVRRELAAKYGDDALYKGGLFVKTTLDPQLQQFSDNALRLALTEYDHRRGYRGPLAHFATMSDWEKQLAALEAKKRFPLFGTERLAVVTETGMSQIAFSDGKRGSLSKESFAWAGHHGLTQGDVIIAAAGEGKESKQYVLHQIPLVNGAMIVIEPHTGRVLAMSGGYAYGGTEFNRATQAHRQPGSAFKPFVYLSAMENGFTPSTIVVDEPVELSQGNGLPMWKPANYSGEYLGPATLRTGLEKSRNAMTVRLGEMLGLPKIVEVGERFGIYDKLPEQFSIVLGAQETTLIRLANAYAMLVNGGKKVSPWLIERIDDHNGKTILKRDPRPCMGCVVSDITTVPETPPLPADDRQQIVDPRVAYQMVSMLEGVALYGTGARAHAVLQRPIAGKTGTTNESRDTWFIGFSPDLVAGIYVGYDQPQSLGRRETGASVALPGFIDFMQHALAGKPSTPFRVPPGIQFIRVDAKTGQPPTPGDTDRTIMEAFKEGEGPETGMVAPEGSAMAIPGSSQPGMPGIIQPPSYNFPAETPSAPVQGMPWKSGGESVPVPPAQPTYLPPSRYENHGGGGGEGTGGLY